MIVPASAGHTHRVGVGGVGGEPARGAAARALGRCRGVGSSRERAFVPLGSPCGEVLDAVHPSEAQALAALVGRAIVVQLPLELDRAAEDRPLASLGDGQGVEVARDLLARRVHEDRLVGPLQPVGEADGGGGGGAAQLRRDDDRAALSCCEHVEVGLRRGVEARVAQEGLE
eukprot:scaffold9908_cov58-Phaeocystis_antarctica.AAC.1